MTGEAGIGKTRLSREIRLYARDRGFLWLEGHYLRGENIAFQPWMEAIRAFLRTAPPGPLEEAPEAYGPELVKLMPELAERLGKVPPSPPIGPEEDRLRFFEALTGFFTRIAREQPLVLFLDDLQWAPSIDALHHLARRVATERLLLLGAYREAELKDEPALARIILALNRERLFHRLPLKRLGKAEVAQMVAQMLGQPVSPRLAEMSYEKTEGNPFFLEEVVHYLTEKGAITLGEKGWDLADATLVEFPDSVKAVVGERLERLGEEARGVLACASVAGQQFTLPLLKEITGMEEEKLLGVVDKAAEARVLIPHPSPFQVIYAFAEEVTRDVLYQGIGRARRRRYHLKVGEGIEKVHARRLAEQYDALAYHFLEGNHPEKALEYTIKGGERAYALYTWERASRLFETALEILEELPEDLSRQAQVLERLADLDRLLGRQGLRHSQEGLELYTRLGEKKKAARMHRLVAMSWSSGMEGQTDEEEALVHSEAAVKLLEAEPDSEEKARSYSGFAYTLLLTLELERGLKYGRQALQIAEGLKDPDEVCFASGVLGMILASRGELVRAQEYAERSWQAAIQGKDHWLKVLSSMLPILHWPWRHDRVWLERWLERFLECRRRYYVQRWDRPMDGVTALRSALSGRPVESLEALRRAEDKASQSPYHFPYLVQFAGVAHAVLGDWETANCVLAGALEAAERGHGRFYLVQACIDYGRFLLASGDVDTAEGVLKKGYSLAHERGSVLQELNLLPQLCELHVQTGRLEQAEKNLKLAQEVLARPQPWRGLAASVYLAEGMLATAGCQWPEAGKAFEQALQAERTYGFQYGEARVLVEWGEMHLKRDAPGDREQGIAFLDQALAIFQRCAAKKDIERVAAIKLHIESRLGKAPAYPDGLTQREVEVLRLVAAGKSNREIAEALIISLRTVANHVTNIFTKVGVANRTQAAAYAIEHGLGSVRQKHLSRSD